MTDRELMEQWIKPGALVPITPDTTRILVEALRAQLAQPDSTQKQWEGAAYRALDQVKELQRLLHEAQPEPFIHARKEGDLIVVDMPKVPTGGGGIYKDQQPKPEPVAWTRNKLNTTTWGEGDWQITVTKDKWGDEQIPLYTAPPKKKWIGLSDETYWEMWVESPSDVLRFAHAIEAKLKEKNSD